MIDWSLVVYRRFSSFIHGEDLTKNWKVLNRPFRKIKFLNSIDWQCDEVKNTLKHVLQNTLALVRASIIERSNLNEGENSAILWLSTSSLKVPLSSSDKVLFKTEKVYTYSISWGLIILFERKCKQLRKIITKILLLNYKIIFIVYNTYEGVLVIFNLPLLFF